MDELHTLLPTPRSQEGKMANLRGLQEGIVNSQIWKSVFRVGIPNTNRKRVLAVLGSLILHLYLLLKSAAPVCA